jgi:hypothetical protein
LLRFIAGTPYAARKVTEAALFPAARKRAGTAPARRMFAGVVAPDLRPPQ